VVLESGDVILVWVTATISRCEVIVLAGRYTELHGMKVLLFSVSEDTLTLLVNRLRRQHHLHGASGELRSNHAYIGTCLPKISLSDIVKIST
jgi:hypothetical protein